MRKLFASVVVLAVLLTSLMSCVELPFISSDNESESAETVTETEQDTAQETESKKNDGTTEKETAKAPDPSPYEPSSKGLQFVLNSDRKSYTLKGIGSCSSKNIFVGSYNGLTVTAIADEAFRSKNIEGLTLSDGVETIGEYAFYYCQKLVRVDLGNGVKKIKEGAFGGCASLQSLTIPDSVTEIGMGGVEFCYGMKELHIGKGLKTVGQNAFAYMTSLERLYFNATKMSDIDSYKNIFFEGGLEGNGISAFIGKEVTRIPAYFFDAYDNYKYAYGAIKLVSVEFEEGSICERIGDSAFLGCTLLREIKNIPDSITYIGNSAFASCESLGSFEMPADLKIIEGNAFTRCTGLGNVVLNSQLEKIGESAFSGCSGITEINIPASMAYIGQKAFSGCLRLSSAEFAQSEGWWYKGSVYPYDVYSIPSVADNATAAKMLRDEYYGATWQRG